MAHYKGAASEGSRAVNLMKQRERQKEELELLKKKIAEVRFLLYNFCACVEYHQLSQQEHGTTKFEVSDKFATSFDVVEEQLKSSTVGKLCTPL